MALMNLKGIMKQKTLMPGLGAAPPIGGSSFMSPPSAGAPVQPSFPTPGGLLKKKAFGKPSQSTEVNTMPNLMKRLTGK
jgi:hypothetical protein